MKDDKMFTYPTTTIGEDGNMVKAMRRATLKELKEDYWNNWADMRMVMQMPVTEEDFVSDLKVIFKMEEV